MGVAASRRSASLPALAAATGLVLLTMGERLWRPEIYDFWGYLLYPAESFQARVVRLGIDDRLPLSLGPGLASAIVIVLAAIAAALIAAPVPERLRRAADRRGRAAPREGRPRRERLPLAAGRDRPRRARRPRRRRAGRLGDGQVRRRRGRRERPAGAHDDRARRARPRRRHVAPTGTRGRIACGVGGDALLHAVGDAGCTGSAPSQSATRFAGVASTDDGRSTRTPAASCRPACNVSLPFAGCCVARSMRGRRRCRIAGRRGDRSGDGAAPRPTSSRATTSSEWSCCESPDRPRCAGSAARRPTARSRRARRRRSASSRRSHRGACLRRAAHRRRCSIRCAFAPARARSSRAAGRPLAAARAGPCARGATTVKVEMSSGARVGGRRKHAVGHVVAGGIVKCPPRAARSSATMARTPSLLEPRRSAESGAAGNLQFVHASSRDKAEGLAVAARRLRRRRPAVADRDALDVRHVDVAERRVHLPPDRPLDRRRPAVVAVVDRRVHARRPASERLAVRVLPRHLRIADRASRSRAG